MRRRRRASWRSITSPGLPGPVTQSDGTVVHAGKDVSTELKTSGTFEFHAVSAKTAATGVEDGTYAFSLTIPSTFSSQLTSTEDFQPQQATLTVTTNDANNYLVGTIADKVSSSVRSTVASTIGEESANKLLLGFSDVHTQLLKAADGADQLVAGAATLGTGASKVAAGAAQLAVSAPSLASGIAQASEGATAANSGAGKLASGAAELHTGAAKLADGEQQAVTSTDTLADGTAQLASGAGELSTGAHTLTDGATELGTQLRSGAGQVPNPDPATRTKTADQIGNPLEVQNTAVSSAGNYGAGLAPFFLGLSMWIGSFVLFLLVRPLSSRALASGASAFQTALGGWLPSAVIGVGQAIVVYVVATALVGIDPAYRWLTFGLLVATALSFTALLHGINAKFGAIGKFIGLVLLILQLVSAGGTFPWQTTPGPLHFLHQILPLGYVVDALRHTIYGAYLPALGTDLMVLAIYLIPGLALSTWAAHSDRRWSLKRLRPELVL